MAADEELCWRILGAWEVGTATTELSIPAGQPRVVLAALLLSVNQPVSLDVLTDQLWPEQPPARPQGTLHTYVSRLRRVLGADRIETDLAGYRLRADESRIDLYKFRDLVGQAADAGSPAAELQVLRTALALWRGRPFGDLTSTWLDRDVVPQLTEEWFAATERRIDLEFAAGPPGALIAELTELTRQYPTREALWFRLIDALRRAGRRAEALDRYHQVRTLLRDEFGIDPSAELDELYRSMLDSGVRRPEPIRQLPHDIRSFVGRDAELTALDVLDREQADDATRIITIDGAPGTGKTTLAVHWAHRKAAGFEDAQLYLNLRGYGPGEPIGPADAAAMLLRALGVAGERIPAKIEERSALLRSTLAGRRVLLLLDNARDADQIRPLLPGSGSLVIVTSRNQLRSLAIRDGARRLTLEPMAPEQAVELLAATIGSERVAAEPEASRELIQLCDRLPLALAIVAERAQRADSLAAVVVALGDAQARLAQLDAGDPQSDLSAALSWSYRALPPASALMFRLLGLHPGDDIGLPAAAALAGLTPAATRVALDHLVAVHLVDQRQADRYEMHDLIRLYATGLAADEPDADAALDRLVDWYLHAALSADERLQPLRLRDFAEPYEPMSVVPEFGTVPAAIAWFEREYNCLRAITTWSAAHGRTGYAWRTVLAMATFLDNRITWDDGLAVFELAVTAAGTDETARGFTLNAIGCFHFDQDDWPRTERYLTEALACFETVGHSRGEAMVLGNLAIVLAELGRPEVAVGLSERAIRLCQQNGYTRGVAVNLDNRGVALAATGRYLEAVEAHLEADRLNAGDLVADAYNQQNLSRAYAALHRPTPAIRAACRSVHLFRRIDNRRWEAGALIDLAKSLLAAHHPTLAATTLQTALTILTDFADPRTPEVQFLLATTQ
ncbi:tetratricopeptide repeat protein [Kribbella sandramycini]|uniref:DNA-binding SARP family transcriptional activator n=1 Tax=Kribbella sandramycini TaxID=60450 RepID=A0A7Y4P0F3_9ACTN|nr:AfsR/SARP family transcriptional regulator [Kribbella sandramycini]MBB6564894.1 DNA-binding SARP family transcriptional activator [Kribbella sandramycini]NOL42591.1 tetratricopeptide repeat protein [Kribbella sandramycini]